MPETITQTQADPKTTAANIVDGIQNKANGKAPEEAPKDGKAPEIPVDPNAGKKKYTVNDKEIWLTPEQADAYVQKGIAFEPKVSQLAHLQNEMGAFFKELVDNPMKILTDKRLGLTPEIVLEKILKNGDWSDKQKDIIGNLYYDNVVEPLKLTPEQLKAREDAKWRDKREREDAMAKDEAIKQENLRRVEAAMAQLKAQVGEAMKESGLPVDGSDISVFFARRAADKMRLARFSGQAITPKDAVAMVKADFKKIQTAWYDILEDDKLVEELGEKNAEKVKKYFLKIVKDVEKKIPVNKNPSTRKGERKTMNMDEFHDQLDELKRNSK